MGNILSDHTMLGHGFYFDLLYEVDEDGNQRPLTLPPPEMCPYCNKVVRSSDKLMRDQLVKEAGDYMIEKKVLRAMKNKMSEHSLGETLATDADRKPRKKLMGWRTAPLRTRSSEPELLLDVSYPKPELISCVGDGLENSEV